MRLKLSPALAGVLAVVRVLPRVSRPLTFFLALGIAASTAFPIAFTITSGLLVGAIPAAVQHGLDSPSGHQLVMLLVLAALTIAGGRIVDPFLFALSTVFGRKLDRYLQERLIAAVGRPVGIEHLEDPRVRDLIATAQGVGGQDTRPGQAVVSLGSLLPSWLTALGSGVILMRFHWWLGLLWIAIWPVVLYYLQREYINVGQIASGVASTLRRSNYYRDLALTPGLAKEVRVWGMTDWLIGRFRASWLGAMSPVWQARRPGRAVLWATTLTVTVMVLGSLALLVHDAIDGAVTLGALAVYVQAVMAISQFRAFDDANMDLAFSAVSVPSVLQLEDQLVGGGAGGGAFEPLPTTRHDTVGRPSNGPTPQASSIRRATVAAATLFPDSPRTGIHFEDVRFHYPRTDQETLNGVDLELPAGHSLAIVGANGAGKTTLVKLLCRLYEPTGGRIAVDGADLRDIDPAAWRAQVAAIYQDFTRYHLTARTNVAMGALHIADDEDRLREAARRAGALDVIESLPHGWDTVLSREYTDGSDLSGGQWQRIALARALFAVEGGARVLILDEPTANLDVRAETKIYDRFLELTAGLTTILISHRFSTVRRAHHIVVLEGGRIAERGNHDELMARDCRYAHMFRLQAERFVEEEVSA